MRRTASRRQNEDEQAPLLPSNETYKRLPPEEFRPALEETDNTKGKCWPYDVESNSKSTTRTSTHCCVVVLPILLIMIILAAIITTAIYLIASGKANQASDPFNDWLHPGPSPSLLTKFKYSTIATDAAPCVNIGNYIMLVKQGNVIDATIATMLCTGVYNLHSMGISGGSFMVFYERSTQKTYALDFRETAPAAATENMFVGQPDTASLYGGKAIAVPGEIAGYYAAWRKWGKVPWRQLFEPTIDLLRNGFHIYPSMKTAMDTKKEDIKNFANPTLLDYLYNKTEDRWLDVGDFRTLPKLANTLEIISQEPMAMYNGSLVNTIVREIQEAGGIITADDLREYEPEFREPLALPMVGTPYMIHGLPPPSCGAMAAFMLNIMSGYGYTKKNISSKNDVATYFHRFVEASKFAFAKRSALGDMNFATPEMEEVLKSLLDVETAARARANISDHQTFEPSYYGGALGVPNDRGTSHISAIDEYGNAVAMTSTINGEFGSMVMGSETGITYNNEMDDFSTPNKSNQYNLPPSPSNFIKPGKRPMSSMSPLIITDTSTGDVKFVLGGSGGSRILSAVSQVAGHHLFLHKNVKEALDMYRFHHQLYPNEIRVSSTFPTKLLEDLKRRGHKVGDPMPGTAVQALAVEADGYIYGNADFRKNGQSGGI